MLCDFIRVVWWSCHCLEQSGTNRLYRMPCAVCVGHVVWLLQCVYGLFCFQSSRTKYAWKGMSADPLWTYEMFVQYLARIIFFLSLSLSVCLSACLPACLAVCLSASSHSNFLNASVCTFMCKHHQASVLAWYVNAYLYITHSATTHRQCCPMYRISRKSVYFNLI